MVNNSIRQLIREIAEKSMPRIVIGVVTETAPLRVVLKDDIGIQLSKASLLIPGGKTLAQGDEWYMLAVNDRKIYYVLDKVS